MSFTLASVSLALSAYGSNAEQPGSMLQTVSKPELWRETLFLFSKTVYYTNTITHTAQSKNPKCLCSQDMQKY